MASSLEDLLAEEGFQGRRLKTTPRPSFASRAVSMPLYPFRINCKADAGSVVKIQTARTRSSVSRYNSEGEAPPTDRVKGRKQKDSLIRREKLDREPKKELNKRFEERETNDVFEDFPGNEIVEVGVEENGRYKDIYSDKEYSPRKRSHKSSHRIVEKERNKERSEKRNSSSTSSIKHLPAQKSLSNNHNNSMKEPHTFLNRSRKSMENNKIFDENRGQNHDSTVQAVSEPALDEVAVQAMVSIISGFVKRFLKDKDFRTLLHHNCFSSLNIIDLEEGESTASKVITTLEQAIETVELVAEESASGKDLKKASLQLSVIAGLSSDDMKDGFTSGVPNYKLSACAHLYLGLIYKLQKKDKASAKHILQVFCDSPFQARTMLLPELWDYLFLPQLSHLKVWYNQEADSLADAPSRQRKLELLEKVYNEILDLGTHQFAIYYKDWLTEGVEAPSVPSIHVPSVSVRGVDQGSSQSHYQELANPLGPFSTQPMVSKKLYNTVFGNSIQPQVGEVEEYGEAEYNCMRSSDDSAVEDKQALTHFSEAVKHTDQHAKEHFMENPYDEAAHPEDGHLLEAEESTRLHGVSAPGERDPSDEVCDSHIRQQTNMESSAKDLHGNCQYFNEGSFFSSIPQDFICPLTGRLFEDPVTIETGQTFERHAIRNGLIRETETVQHLLAFASKVEGSSGEHGVEPKDETAIYALEQFLSGSSKEEKLTNAKHLISLGGLQFLTRRFELGNLEEKTCVAALMCSCIEADYRCKNEIAKYIKKPCLLELLHSKQAKSRTNAVLLLTELICMHRWKDVTLFLSSFQNEGIMSAMHVLLVYLQSSSPEQRPLVAVLLLHLDLLVEPQKYSIYREEAVDAIVVALEGSLTDENVREKCCRALLILTGHFSFSGDVPTEKWILKPAGPMDSHDLSSCNNEENGLLVDGTISLDAEEQAKEEWFRNLSAVLLGNGQKSFLEAISKCLGSDSTELVRVCLTTVAWLSSALSSLSDAEFQLSAFSALISRLRDNLENSEQIEHKILASASLLSFSKIPECRVLLMTIAEEIVVPLRSLVQVTWTAKHLYTTISGEDL
ncbi:putative E3 ubiquitin-protein ligase LIN-1 [Vitis vinifera]|uniref:RING-type E3 ubiquitin transferase n=1 Tax=Vitis vinifera TaxID=29760 RepID=A0A438ELF3_VITVI|nr:putative E3 ubiquitin-protein ligase LIN-1 [Vitis vinifera]